MRKKKVEKATLVESGSALFLGAVFGRRWTRRGVGRPEPGRPPGVRRRRLVVVVVELAAARRSSPIALRRRRRRHRFRCWLAREDFRGRRGKPLFCGRRSCLEHFVVACETHPPGHAGSQPRKDPLRGSPALILLCTTN